MKGLILKDLLNIKSQVKVIGLIIVVQAVIFIPQGDVSFINGITTLMCTMMVITTISYDDMAKWDKYALTMPITRKEMILSKYVVLLIFSIVGALIGCIFSVGSVFFIKSVNIEEMLISSAMVLSIALIFGGIILPLLYKFGPEKARLLIILCALVPTGIIMLSSQVLKNSGVPKPSMDFLNTFVYIIPVIAIIVFVISYFVSLKIYMKKEF